MLYGVYAVCDIMKQMKRQTICKTAHNTLHFIKFANRLYRVIVLYSLYYPKLK